MKRSEDHILTTHAGSLPRPNYLQPLLHAKRTGEPYDPDELAQKVRQAVKEVVDQQVEFGIDVIGEGEESKPSFNLYLDERISGFEMKVPAPGQVPSMSLDGRDRTDFREFYSEEQGFGLRLVSSEYQPTRDADLHRAPLLHRPRPRQHGRRQLQDGVGGSELRGGVYPHPRSGHHRPPALQRVLQDGGGVRLRRRRNDAAGVRGHRQRRFRRANRRPRDCRTLGTCWCRGRTWQSIESTRTCA